jgi:hypothetical protein
VKCTFYDDSAQSSCLPVRAPWATLSIAKAHFFGLDVGHNRYRLATREATPDSISSTDSGRARTTLQLFQGTAHDLRQTHTSGTKRTLLLQASFLAGCVGGMWLMATQDSALPVFVAEHPWATFLIGPAFVAVTGVAVKEGLCYAKAEAALLAAVRAPGLVLNTSFILP